MVRTTVSLLLGAIAWSTSGQVPVGERKSNNPVYYYEKAESLFSQRLLDSALIYYNQSIILNPVYSEAYYGRAVVYEKLDRPENALRDYTIAFELKPTHFEALLGRAILRYTLEKWAQAEEDFRQLLTMEPGETTTVFFQQDAFGSGVDRVFTAAGGNRAYVYNYLGLTETRLKKLDAAISHFDSAFQQQPDADYLVNKGLCLQMKGDDSEAKRLFDRALQLDPGNAIAKHNLGVLASQQGNNREAEAMLDNAIEENPNLPYPYAERAYRKLLSGDYTGAITDYTSAIKLNPKDAEYLLNRAIAFEKLQQWGNAYDDYSKAIQISPRLEKAWFNRGNLMYRLKKYNDAIKDYDVAIAVYPGYAHAYYSRALARYYAGKKEDACSDLLTAEGLSFDIPGKVKTALCGMNK